MALYPWFDRTFPFADPVGKYPDILERLRGTPARLEDRLRGLPAELLTRREREGTWSIQENAGHLADLEHLHEGRLDDFDAGADVLRAADLTNRATFRAAHNDRPLEDVLAEFRTARGRLVARCEQLPPAAFARSARHPRLGTTMRLVDCLLFFSDHDDYHLARISELIRIFTPAPGPARD